jgi:hypothetical protein
MSESLAVPVPTVYCGTSYSTVVVEPLVVVFGAMVMATGALSLL